MSESTFYCPYSLFYKLFYPFYFSPINRVSSLRVSLSMDFMHPPFVSIFTKDIDFTPTKNDTNSPIYNPFIKNTSNPISLLVFLIIFGYSMLSNHPIKPQITKTTLTVHKTMQPQCNHNCTLMFSKTLNKRNPLQNKKHPPKIFKKVTKTHQKKVKKIKKSQILQKLPQNFSKNSAKYLYATQIFTQKHPNIRQILIFIRQIQTNLPKMGNFCSSFSKKVN